MFMQNVDLQNYLFHLEKKFEIEFSDSPQTPLISKTFFCGL